MSTSMNVVVVGLAGMVLPVAVWAEAQVATCATCHPEQSDDVAKSVHGSFQCRECHQGEKSYSLSPEEAGKYLRPGGASRPVFDHGSAFRGKPPRLEVPELCGACHTDIERMNPYGLRTDQLARYKTSGHGKALYEGKDDKVAICIDCHGSHSVLPARNPQSLTHPVNVPKTCGTCHEDRSLMEQYGLSTEVLTEYRESVHGRLLLEQGDTGAPTCATCHGNHSAVPPGYANVGAVCGRCHQDATEMFAKSVHADLPDFKGCVQCHGDGEGSHLHRIKKMTRPSGVLIQRYAYLLREIPTPTTEQVRQAIHPAPERMMEGALEGCMECHDEVEEDESLAKMFTLLGEVADAERLCVETGHQLEEIAHGMLLVDRQLFTFEDAKTHLIELASVQHSLDDEAVAEKTGELAQLCDQINAELDELETHLTWRRQLLVPIWVFAVVFSAALYVKYKRLKTAYVQPEHVTIDRTSSPSGEPACGTTRRGFLDWVIGLWSAAAGAAMTIPAVVYLWPAARGGDVDRVEIEGAENLPVGESTMVQLGGKAVIVVRSRSEFRAFSAACTHLGCLVKWDGASQEFKCPCHAAVFDKDGGVVSGPPPSPLPKYTVREIGDKVFVSRV